ncbi:MAG: ROK family protein [Bryobacterales bacterium]
MAEFGIGVDLGGTNLRAAAVDLEGNLLELFQISTDTSAGRDKVVADIVAGIQEVREGHSGDKLVGIGVGVPGLIYLEKGVVAKAPNLPGWEDFPLRDLLEKDLKCPVILENDANAAALGEVWMGAGHDVEDLVLLTLGTGIGGGIISNGRVLHGYLGMAGELGHITVEPHSGVRCGCGNYGCVEAHASATAIARMAEEAVSIGSSKALAALKEEHGQLTALLVERAAREGDPEAIKIFERMGEWLGRAMANLVNIFNFPLYLVAGGLVGGWKLFSPSMFQEIEKRSVTYRESDTRIKKAKLGNKAGLFGAAYLPILEHKSR